MTNGFGLTLLALAAPLLIAASGGEGEGLSGGALVMMSTAIVGVIVLRGVFLRRHLRKRRKKDVPNDRIN